MKKIKLPKINSKILYPVAGALVGLFALAVYLFGIQSPIKSDVTLQVSRGQSVGAYAEKLHAQGYINSVTLFKISVRLMGGQIQSGKYEVQRGDSVWRLAHMFARGNIATTTIVVPEGLTIKQIKQQLLADESLTGDVECSRWSVAPVCSLNDGDVFPDTYRVAYGTSRLALLDLMREKMQSVRDKWVSSGANAPKPLSSWNDVITLASIVQKETYIVSEMPIVASVYLNRLNTRMRLQADPTVVYAMTNGLGDMQGTALLRSHLKTESPYNTYTNYGLPPAPIANVGSAAIRAVLNPADTNYLFFVADGQGGHTFADTYQEHLVNQNAWRAIKNSK